MTITGLAVIAVGAMLAVQWRSTGRAESLIALYALTFWMFSLVLGMGLVPWRPHAMLLPMAIVARRLPVPVLLPLLLLAIAGDASLAVLFFGNVVQ